jgi:antitoxin ParD1/3/4
MNVSLTPELEQLINQKVATGLYNSASEVIREGLRLLKEQDDLKRLRHETLRNDILLGQEEIRQGKGVRYSSAEELGTEIKRRGRALREARGTGTK